MAAGVAVALAGLALAWLLLVKSLAAPGWPFAAGRGRSSVAWRPCAGAGPGRSGAARRRALARAYVGLEEEGVPVAEGSAVVVESIDGLTLTVRPAEEWEVH